MWGLPWGSVKALCPPPNPLGALPALPASKSGVTPPGMALEKGHAERGEITRVGEQMGNRPPRVAQGDGLARAAASADFQNIEGKLTGRRADVYSTRFPDSGAFTELCGQNLRPVPEPSTTRETPRPHRQSPTPPLSQPGQTHPLPVWERSRTPAPRPRGSASPAERRAFRGGLSTMGRVGASPLFTAE